MQMTGNRRSYLRMNVGKDKGKKKNPKMVLEQKTTPISRLLRQRHPKASLRGFLGKIHRSQQKLDRTVTVMMILKRNGRVYEAEVELLPMIQLAKIPSSKKLRPLMARARESLICLT